VPYRNNRPKTDRVAVLASPHTGSYPFFEREIRPQLVGRARIYLTSNRYQLTIAVDRIYEQKPEVIVICGGDGAMHVCLTAIANRYADTGQHIPQILMLALGTMNDAATSLDIAADPVGLLARVMRKLKRGQALQVKLFRPMTVNGECAFLYGAGMPVAFLQRYYRDKPPGAIGGPIGGVMTFGSVLWSEVFIELGLADNNGWLQRLMDTFGLGEATGLVNYVLDELGMSDAAEWQSSRFGVRLLSADGNPVEPYRQNTGLMASVISQIGMGLKAFRYAMNYQGSFTLRQTNLSFAEVVAIGPVVLSGIEAPGINDRIMKNAILEYDRPLVRTVDGDLKDPRQNAHVHPTRDVLGIGPLLEIIVG
jgi:hypothetical protein